MDLEHKILNTIKPGNYLKEIELFLKKSTFNVDENCC